MSYRKLTSSQTSYPRISQRTCQYQSRDATEVNDIEGHALHVWVCQEHAQFTQKQFECNWIQQSVADEEQVEGDMCFDGSPGYDHVLGQVACGPVTEVPVYDVRELLTACNWGDMH